MSQTWCATHWRTLYKAVYFIAGCRTPNLKFTPKDTRNNSKSTSRWAAGSPEESNTQTQKPHDAIFMIRRALETSLWKIWMPIILFPIAKTNGSEERRLTQWQFGWTDNTFQNSFWEQIRTHEGIREGETLRLCALISVQCQPRPQT